MRELLCRTSCRTCSPISCWAALTTCSACASIAAWSSLTPTPSSHSSSPCHTAFPLANAPVHNSCAPQVSPQLNCETVAIILWPANRPFVGCLLRKPLSFPFCFCLLAWSVALLLGCRRGFEKAACFPLTSPGRTVFTNPAQPCRVKIPYVHVVTTP